MGATQCLISPIVKMPNGTEQPSQLYDQIYKMVGKNRDLAWSLYAKVINKEFTDKYKSKLQFNAQGQPTLESIVTFTNISDNFVGDEHRAYLEKAEGFVGNDGAAIAVSSTPQNLAMSIDKAVRFNKKKNKMYVALPKVNRQGQIYIELVPRTNANLNAAADMEKSKKFSDVIIPMLQRAGISVESISELEHKAGLSGIVEFNTTDGTVQGVKATVRLANDLQGIASLPKQVSYLAVAALKDTALGKRLMKLASNKNIQKAILGSRYESMADNPVFIGKMATETAAALFSKYLQGDTVVSQHESFMSNIVATFKSLFGKIDEQELETALKSIDGLMQKAVADINSGNFDFSNLSKPGNNTSQAIKFQTEKNNPIKNIIYKIIHNQVIAVNLLRARKYQKDFVDKQKELVSEMTEALSEGMSVPKIAEYLTTVGAYYDAAYSSLSQLQVTETSAKQVAEILYQYGVFMQNYDTTLQFISRQLEALKSKPDKTSEDVAVLEMEQYVKELVVTHGKFKALMLNRKKEAAIVLFKGAVGSNSVLNWSKAEGRLKDTQIDQLLSEMEEDISTADMLLYAASQSDSAILGIMDDITKKAKDTARQKTYEYNQRIKAMAKVLEQAGYKNTDFMLQRTADGKLTGRYIYKYQKDYFKSIREAYLKKTGKPEDAFLSFEEDKDWAEFYQKNKDNYLSTDYLNLSAEQRAFYDQFMEIKEELDKYLPQGITKNNSMIRVRVDFLERLKRSQSISDGAKSFYESFKDLLVDRNEETQFGVGRDIVDFYGRDVSRIPIFFIKGNSVTGVDDAMKDLSLDCTSCLMAYAAMSSEYHHLSEIATALENVRDVVSNSDLFTIKKIDRGTSKVQNKAQSVSVVSNRRIENEGSNMVKAIDNFLTTKVFGQQYKREGTLWGTKLSTGKTANFINQMVSLSQLACNVPSAVANLIAGLNSTIVSAVGGKYFNLKDLAYADKEYYFHLPGMINDSANRVPYNKMTLFLEMFDIREEFDKQKFNMDWDKKGVFKRFFNVSTFYIMQNMGEHYLSARTAIAMANRFKLKDSTGNEISLWEALELKDMVAGNPAAGKRLVLKDGVTNLDGTEVTEADFQKFSRSVHGVNHELQGIYNQQDRSMLQHYSYGRLLLMYRKHIIPFLKRRYGKEHYNYDTGTVEEGFYRQFFGFLSTCVKNLAQGVSLAETYKQYKNTKPDFGHNVRQAMTELTMFFSLLLLMNTLGSDGDDDETYMKSMLRYQVRRAITDIGAFAPTSHVKDEAFKMLKSPMASMNLFDNTLNLFGLLQLENYGEEAIIKRGRWKGYTKAQRILLSSPFVPMYNTLQKNVHMKELADTQESMWTGTY